MWIFFAAIDHMNYAKCSQLYLQSMQDLQVNDQWLFNQYCKPGFHCVTHTDWYSPGYDRTWLLSSL